VGLGRSFSRQELIAKVHTAGLPIDDLQLPESVMVRRKSQGLDTLGRRSRQDAFARQYPDADIRIVSIDTPEVGVATGPWKSPHRCRIGCSSADICGSQRSQCRIFPKGFCEDRCRGPKAATHIEMTLRPTENSRRRY
jgi:hypothetical protein